MRLLTIFFLCISISALADQNKKPCNKAYENLDIALLNFDKAYNTDHSRDLRNFTRKAKNALLKAMNASEDCGCQDALSAALDGAIETKKVMKATNFEDALYYLSVSRGYTEEAMSYLTDCILEFEIRYEAKVFDTIAPVKKVLLAPDIIEEKPPNPQ